MGRIVVRHLNRRNAEINAFAVQQLELVPQDRVLEVGFGGGVSMPAFIARAAFVCGIDRSQQAVKQARARFSKAVRDGRGDFCLGTVEALPFAGASFTKVCTVQTIYFWTSLDAGFSEIHRVLSPGGRVAVGFIPKEAMERAGVCAEVFTTRSPDEVLAALEKAGFMDVRLMRPEPGTRWIVAVARRPVCDSGA